MALLWLLADHSAGGLFFSEGVLLSPLLSAERGLTVPALVCSIDTAKILSTIICSPRVGWG